MYLNPVFKIQDLLDLIFGDSAIPQPDRVRFYQPNLEQFHLICLRFREYCGEHSNVINPNYLINADIWLNFCTYFLRSYMIIVHWDVYRAYNVAVQGLTPSKLKPVMTQPIPVFILSAIRELCRPMISADGFIFYPLFTNVNYPNPAPQTVVRNGIPIGVPDAYLNGLGIVWFPTLRAALPNFYAGQQYKTDVSREGLEPCKITVFASWPDDPAHISLHVFAVHGVQDEVSHDSNDDADLNLQNPDIDSPEETEYLQAIQDSRAFVNHCWITDLSSDVQEEADRDAAARMLRHFQLRLPGDPFIKYNFGLNDLPHLFWAPLQFFGRDVYRGQILVSISNWQMEFVFPSQGYRDYFADQFYLNRFLTQLDEDFSNFHFPTFGTTSEPSDRQIGQGPNRRKRRGKRQNQKKKKLKDEPYKNEEHVQNE